MIRQVCSAVRTLGFSENTKARNPADTAYHTANSKSGVVAAIATAVPTRCSVFLNQPNADPAKAIPNHAPTSHDVSFPYRFIAFLPSWSPPPGRQAASADSSLALRVHRASLTAPAARAAPPPGVFVCPSG